VIASRGSGSTVSITAAGAALEGVTIDGSGGRFDLLDAAVRVHADDARVEGVTIRNALFGVLVERSRGVLVRGNRVLGDPQQTLGLRGDGIRLWEVRESRVEANQLSHSRDIVIWYAPGNRISGNRVEGGRYGTHLMYSHGNRIEDNRYVGNVVGIFAMYSRDLAIRRNLIARSAGAAGVGLGAKESGALVVEDNWFIANTVGTYLDTSPLEPDDHNRFRGNVFRFSDAAVVFHGVAERNAFVGNSFRDNGIPVRVEGRGDAQAATWRGNDYDDYAGYDLDGDGVGDLPYELRSLSSTLESRSPALAFFRGTVAMGLVELVGEALPLFRPTTLMVDPAPRMRAPASEPVWADS
jgi:nitrous oxidase accessory protein